MNRRDIISRLESLRRQYALARVPDEAAVLVECICRLTDAVPEDEVVHTLSLLATTLRYGYLDFAPSDRTRK